MRAAHVVGGVAVLESQPAFFRDGGQQQVN